MNIFLVVSSRVLGAELCEVPRGREHDNVAQAYVRSVEGAQTGQIHIS